MDDQQTADLPEGAPSDRAGPLRQMQAYLPRGNTLDPEAVSQRHLLLSWLLGLHVPGLLLFGLWRGAAASHLTLELLVPVACLVLGRIVRARRLAALFVTAGLVYCSATLVHLSGGMIEAHFHFFILLGFIALYQDWVPFLWNVVFVVASHGVGTTMDADSMFNHYAAQNRPWLWAGIHGVTVLAACTGMVILWRQTELAQQRSLKLKDQLVGAELAKVELAQRRSVSTLLIHLARRNQLLLSQQLDLIARLEEHERQPEPLAELFKLDHLATRMRRNAESLLVLSGEEPQRRWREPVRLSTLLRAAAAEVEAYTRVDVAVNEHLEVAGQVVADLTHLLAELIENATTFSPAEAPVRVQSYLWPEGEYSSAYLISVEDRGIGMDEDHLRAANLALSSAPEIDPTWRTLGLHVVSRLARRHGLRVRLASTAGSGVTALVSLPSSLMHERRDDQTIRSMPRRGAPGPVAGPPSAPPPPLAHLDAASTTGPDARHSGGSPQLDLSTPARHVAHGAGLVAPDLVYPQNPAPGGGWAGRAAGEKVDGTVGGLSRRVPGRHVAAGLPPGPRRRPQTDEPSHDRDRSRSRLSRFQVGQETGREEAAADQGLGNGHRPDPGGPGDGDVHQQHDVAGSAGSAGSAGVDGSADNEPATSEPAQPNGPSRDGHARADGQDEAGRTAKWVQGPAEGQP